MTWETSKPRCGWPGCGHIEADHYDYGMCAGAESYYGPKLDWPCPCLEFTPLGKLDSAVPVQDDGAMTETAATAAQTPADRVAEFVRQWKRPALNLRREPEQVVHMVHNDPEAETATVTLADLEALVAMVRAVQAKAAEWEAYQGLPYGFDAESGAHASGQEMAYQSAGETLREMLESQR